MNLSTFIILAFFTVVPFEGFLIFDKNAKFLDLLYILGWLALSGGIVYLFSLCPINEEDFFRLLTLLTIISCLSGAYVSFSRGSSIGDDKG